MELFYYKINNQIVATGYFQDKNWRTSGNIKFILQKGSKVNLDIRPDFLERCPGYKTRINDIRLISRNGILDVDYTCNSPSMAGTLISGRESDGYIEFNIDRESEKSLIFSDNKIQNRKEDGSPYFRIRTKNTPTEKNLEVAYNAEDFDKILRDSAPAINLNHTSLFVAKKLCDALPDEFWNDPEIYNRKILNPFGDSGFLEKFIIHRLINTDAMKEKFPDYGERVYHILHNMIFSIAKTNAASYWLRKIVYYSADATKNGKNGDYPTIFNGKLFSVGGDSDKLESYKMTGNIKSPWIENEIGENNIFNYPMLDWIRYEEEYTDKNGNKKTRTIERDPLDYFARVFWDIFTNEKYNEIEEERRTRIMSEIKSKLKGYFDVIIGNPPYNTNNPDTGKVDKTIYQEFCLAANSLNPKYQSFIIPSKWLDGKANGHQMTEFMEHVLENDRFLYLELIDGKEAFPSVDINEVCIYTFGDKTKNICFNGNIVKREEILREDKDGRKILNRMFNSSILEKIKQKISKFLEPEVKTIYYKNGLVYDDHAHDILSNSGAGFKYTKEKVILNGIEYDRPTLDYSLKRDDKYSMKVYIPNVKLHRGDKPIFEKGEFIGCLYAEPAIINDWCGNNFSHNVLMYNGIGNYVTGTLDWPWNAVTVKPGEIMVGAHTYAIGTDMTDIEVENLRRFIQTKFVTYLIRQVQSSQNITSNIFALVPKMDFTQTWDDDKINKYFGFSQEEIDIINADFEECTISIRNK